MKKYIAILLGFVVSITVLTGCGEDSSLTQYKNDMKTFFSDIIELDEKINSIDPTSKEAVTELLSSMDELELNFQHLAALTVPEEFAMVESLADEASEYMTEANEYYHQSFSESSYNEYTAEAAYECYTRANKRLQYIIDILHGELPEDESISYTEE